MDEGVSSWIAHIDDEDEFVLEIGNAELNYTHSWCCSFVLFNGETSLSGIDLKNPEGGTRPV